MARKAKNQTKDLPLKFAKELSEKVNQEWESGELLKKVSPITQELLKFWFTDSFSDIRSVNFHIGQKQAILNIIYCYEVLKASSPMNLYNQIGQEFLNNEDFKNVLEKEKKENNYPKYCVKMATGTGKTWVLNALLIWQLLNAKNMQENSDIAYTKNFLLIAPGLIVYDRLLDTLLGKEGTDGKRDFATADLKRYEDLFVPVRFRDTVFSFIQNNIVKKEDIGRKITGEGIIAITNWHQMKVEDIIKEKEEPNPLEDPSFCVQSILPIRLKDNGYALEQFDNGYLKEDKLKFLASLPNLCVFNDEAHHLYGVNQNEEDLEWQKSILNLAEKKGNNFIQVDFTATPYHHKSKVDNYFTHIIVDFDLKEAINNGLVKIIGIDKRNDYASISNEDLDFKATRDNGKVIGLSDGQRLMIDAGLKRLEELEAEFVSFDPTKHPKMMIMCEDTEVSPLVVDFLKNKGLDEHDILRIDSDKKGQIPDEKWNSLKQKLFNIDKLSSPKVIVSVLMLREGFDVNNICIIVPLRSAKSQVLLEQIVGRGLRLMWREPMYMDIHRENLECLKQHKEPTNRLDFLSIIEHPYFIDFYDKLEKGIIVEDKKSPERVLGDMISVGLKQNYEEYDLFFPQIIKEREELVKPEEIDISKLRPIEYYSVEQLKKIAENHADEEFYTQDLVTETKFGKYKVSADFFNASSYNDFLVKILGCINQNIVGRTEFPTMTINQVSLIKMLDNYIRHKLFGKEFDPIADNNWRILMIAKQGIVKHIMEQIGQIIYDMQNNVIIEGAIVNKHWFSKVNNIKIREKYALDIKKSIYTKTPYPSNKGNFEKDFLNFADKDSDVKSLIKLDKNYFPFIAMRYIRTDGLLSSYYPDFIVRFDNNIFLVETKATTDLDNANVHQKEKAALDWCRRINELKPEDRMNCQWDYAILDNESFYNHIEWKLKYILEHYKLTRTLVNNTLF